MNDSWITVMAAHYDWLSSLLALLVIIVATRAGKWLIFRVPALREMKRLNRLRDKDKWAKEKYPPMVKASQKVGLYCNIAFFVCILPFCITTDAQPLWLILLSVFLLLMFYDFLYYLMHRFWFHGNGAMRQVHAVHHQARTPTYIDAFYVHPTETFLGLALYFCCVILFALLLGPLHIATIVLSFVIYTQLNTLNHTLVDLPYFPFKTLSWITAKHHVHHENMQRGNYASLSMLFDKLFGTLN